MSQNGKVLLFKLIQEILGVDFWSKQSVWRCFDTACNQLKFSRSCFLNWINSYKLNMNICEVPNHWCSWRFQRSLKAVASKYNVPSFPSGGDLPICPNTAVSVTCDESFGWWRALAGSFFDLKSLELHLLNREKGWDKTKKINIPGPSQRVSLLFSGCVSFCCKKKSTRLRKKTYFTTSRIQKYSGSFKRQKAETNPCETLRRNALPAFSATQETSELFFQVEFSQWLKHVLLAVYKGLYHPVQIGIFVHKLL